MLETTSGGKGGVLSTEQVSAIGAKYLFHLGKTGAQKTPVLFLSLVFRVLIINQDKAINGLKL